MVDDKKERKVLVLEMHMLNQVKPRCLGSALLTQGVSLSRVISAA